MAERDLVVQHVRYSHTPEGLVVTGYGGPRQHLAIPSEINKTEVVRIGRDAFRGSDRLTTVFVHPNIRTIEESAFEGSSLESIDLPSSLSHIETRAFAHCAQLTRLVFFGDMPTMSHGLFEGSPNAQIFYQPDAQEWAEDEIYGIPIAPIVDVTDRHDSRDNDADEDFEEFDQEDGPADPALEVAGDGDENADDYEYYEPEGALVAEVNAFTRVSTGIMGASLKNVTNPIEAFRIRLGIVFSKIPNHVSNIEKQAMLDRVAEIPDIRYKNPEGYVLGYIASQGGRKMTVESYKRALLLLDRVNDKDSLTPPDIVRYGAFWLKINARK